MKKIFIVSAEHCTWDQYDSVVVLAESAEEAVALGQNLFELDEEDTDTFQGKISAEEIDLNSESGIVHTSFNAG